MQQCKDRLTKWLLTATLLISICTGSPGSSQTREHLIAKTELVIFKEGKTCRRTISYDRRVNFPGYDTTLDHASRNWTTALVAHNTRIKIKINNITKQFYAHKSDKRTAQVKQPPKVSNEDHFYTSLKGSLYPSAFAPR